jgi:hypothetical protein
MSRPPKSWVWDGRSAHGFDLVTLLYGSLLVTWLRGLRIRGYAYGYALGFRTGAVGLAWYCLPYKSDNVLGSRWATRVD